MIDSVIEKKDCCGCKVCADICPKESISFLMDEEGFWYPKVNISTCINCGQCVKICPQLSDKNTISNCLGVYATKNKNEKILMESSSGGFFSNLASTVISEGGIVYGVCYDKNIKAVFWRVDNLEDLKFLRGSKYVQADTQGIYKKVLKDLKDDKLVMFVGTPCQVAALKELKNKYRNKLLLVDFICHGVNSPKLFSEFIRFVEKKRKKRILFYYNRSKITGWNHTEMIGFEDGTNDYESPLSQAWRNIFYNHNCLRPTCYHCLYNSYDRRRSDITIADYWGIEKYHPNFDFSNGTSLVVIYSSQGMKWFEKSKNSMVFVSSKMENCLDRQPHFRGESAKTVNRIQFWEDYKFKGIGYIIKKYGKYDVKNITKYFLKRYINKVK